MLNVTLSVLPTTEYLEISFITKNTVLKFKLMSVIKIKLDKTYFDSFTDLTIIEALKHLQLLLTFLREKMNFLKLAVNEIKILCFVVLNICRDLLIPRFCSLHGKK